MNRKKNICVLAWNHIATNQNGDLKLCCNSNSYDNFIKDSKNKTININDVNLDLSKNAWLVDVRKKMLADQTVSYCKKCQTLETMNISSPRVYFNNLYAKTLENIEETKTLEHIPEYLDLRFGNLCNLKCRMCNPISSSQWKQDWEELHQTKVNINISEWYNDPKFIEFFTKHSKNIDMIYLTGGEPTLIDAHYKLFDILISNNTAHKIKLKYNTNLTNIPKKIIDYWYNFNEITINSSIDGFDKINRYIRYPSNWNKIQQNLNILVKLKQTYQNKYIINISPTIQILNVYWMCEFLDWFVDYQDNISPPYFNFLEIPVHYNIQALPMALKDEIKEKFSTYSLKDANYKAKLEDTINYMFDKDLSSNWPTFTRITKKLDSMRNENIFSINPQFKHYFGGESD